MEAGQTFQLYFAKYQRLDLGDYIPFMMYLRFFLITAKPNEAIWNVHAKPKLYSLAYKAWRLHGPQDLTSWTELAQAVLDGCYEHKLPDAVFQVPDSCAICLSPMHWPEKTHCGHTFHMHYLQQHLDVSNTCPLCRAPNPLRAP
ncbi:hypothetical protein TNCV_3792581 [Trichonephila clavipes]|nr:hypothetical protein TNCV_3792581 [Trichonephila clavipes]